MYFIFREKRRTKKRITQEVIPGVILFELKRNEFGLGHFDAHAFGTDARATNSLDFSLNMYFGIESTLIFTPKSLQSISA